MEEDILILEQIIKDYKEISPFFTEKTKYELINVRIIVTAIENLIARNKELEEKQKKLKQKNIDIEYKNLLYELYYIPKSKIKEILETTTYPDFTLKKLYKLLED